MDLSFCEEQIHLGEGRDAKRHPARARGHPGVLGPRVLGRMAGGEKGGSAPEDTSVSPPPAGLSLQLPAPRVKEVLSWKPLFTTWNLTFVVAMETSSWGHSLRFAQKRHFDMISEEGAPSTHLSTPLLPPPQGPCAAAGAPEGPSPGHESWSVLWTRTPRVTAPPCPRHDACKTALGPVRGRCSALVHVWLC